MNAREEFEALAQELEDDNYSSIAKDIRAILAAHELVPKAEMSRMAQKMMDGTYHVVWCNADHDLPFGCPGCSYPTGKEIKRLRVALEDSHAENESLRAELATTNEYVDELRAKLMRAKSSPITKTDIMSEVRKQFPVGDVRSHTAIAEFTWSIIDKRENVG